MVVFICRRSVLTRPRKALVRTTRGEELMKKALLAAAALVALPLVAQAQTAQPGFYIGAEGGLNWLLNTTILSTSVSPQTGFAAGGVIATLTGW